MLYYSILYHIVLYHIVRCPGGHQGLHRVRGQRAESGREGEVPLHIYIYIHVYVYIYIYICI